MTVGAALDRLAQLYGIEPEYSDIWGRSHKVSDETKLALLEAMGLHVEGESHAQARIAEHEDGMYRRLVDPVVVTTPHMPAIRLSLKVPKSRFQVRFEWTLTEEQGRLHSGAFVPEKLELQESRVVDGEHFLSCTLVLDAEPDAGYHHVEIRESDGKDAGGTLSGSIRLIVTPKMCYVPSGLEGAARIWGPAIQLYALRSGRNWGVGDFTDLKGLATYCADTGAGVLGLNPLHSLFPGHPEHANPYSPSSRVFLNFLYLDVEAAPDFAECEEARNTVQSPELQARLAALRDTDLVDFAEVSAVKRPILEILYQHFRKHHLKSESQRGQAFRAFQAAGGEALQAYGVFEALQEHFHGNNPSALGWETWPEAYRDPRSQAVTQFASSNQDRVEFFQYLQWQADLQLGAVGHVAMKRGLKVGLYEDLAVGANGSGFDAWIYQDVYALGARVGAPPDDFSLKGQDWGVPPMIPVKLVEAAYAPFIAALRSNMRHAGAIRLDHVMQIIRLFWLPPEKGPSEGAYVRYPFRDLLGIVALESHRNRCLVIGEDLGTVPDEVREPLRDMGVLSYRLLYFEKDTDGSYIKPADYPEQAVAAVTTHDLPTLYGYWQGRDLAVRAELDLFPTEQWREAQLIARSEDRIRLLFALKREALLPEGINVEAVSLPEMSPNLVTAIHLYLARSPAKILMYQLEDLLEQVDQVNLPGTTVEYPNWQRKLPVLLESFPEDSRLESLVMALRLERGLGTMPRLSLAWREERMPVSPRVPMATYRLQFNKDFNFAEAANVLPYLRRLGVSHCYASPYLMARPGSTHGYDIVDHRALNPELGTNEDFEHFVSTLHEHGMGQVLDIVPNHMAAGCDNPWWVNILENGQASIYAGFFDVAWHPFKDELRGKVLLPVLEDHYGEVLEKALLRLGFDPEAGEFSLWYHEHRFPIDPGTYPLILSHGLERLELRIGAKASHYLEFQSLITAFENLPRHWETAEDKVAARNRDKEVHKRHLVTLCRASSKIKHFIEETVVLFNGTTGEPASFDLLHRLLQAQPYRLAYWRVASDDINYRRFFDINELAALRMENRNVFEETHRLVLDMIRERKVQGLRIDHIDGLYDPRQYCQWLRDEIRNVELEGLGPAERTLDSCETPLGAGSPYLVVEKVLAGREQLPSDWPVHGTTGYDFSSLMNGLFVDTGHERSMDRIYTRFTGRKTDFDALLYECKKLIIRVAMASELNVLANDLSRIAESHRHSRDFTVNRLREALREIVSCFPVYRTYVTEDKVTAEDRRYVDWAIALAKRRSRAADTSIYDFVGDVLVLSAFAEQHPTIDAALVNFAMRFQQFTGPVMAKGMEDTSFYIYNRLISLNEVGGDPRRFGISVPAFHHANRERISRWPHAMLNSSTHDSKRSEDVRARINVLSEIPDLWETVVRRWSRVNRSKKRKVEANLAPSKNDEYALYQILIGAWPLEDFEDNESRTSFCERIKSYMIKAAREAKVHSSWVNPDTQYEDAVESFVGALLENRRHDPFLEEFLPFQRRIARLGMFNSLSQVLLKLTCPGVPDIYRGNEVWNFSLVDPDNRRAVDFARYQGMLDELQSSVSVPEKELPERVGELMKTMEDGRIKLYVTWKSLSLRWECQDVFQNGAYVPIQVRGKNAENLCAYARQYEDKMIVVAVPRLYARLCGFDAEVDPLGEAVWRDTWLETSFCSTGTQFKNVFTGEVWSAESPEGSLGYSVARLLAFFPVALLIKA